MFCLPNLNFEFKVKACCCDVRGCRKSIYSIFASLGASSADLTQEGKRGEEL